MTITSNLRRSLKAGALYFILVFAIAFIFAAIREGLIVPRFGETIGVLTEVPILLVLAWFISSSVMARYEVPQDVGTRVLVGATAFCLLLAAEISLSLGPFGNTLAEHFAAYSTLPGAIGLSGQVVFALFPVIQLLTPSRT